MEKWKTTGRTAGVREDHVTPTRRSVGPRLRQGIVPTNVGPLAPHVREAHAYQIALAARFPRVVNVNPTVKLNTDLIASDSRLAASQVLVYKNTLDIEQVLWRKKRYGTGKMQNKKKSSPTNPSKSTVKSIPELLHRKHKTFFTVPAIHPRTNRRKIGRLEIVKNDTYVHRSMQPST